MRWAADWRHRSRSSRAPALCRSPWASWRRSSCRCELLEALRGSGPSSRMGAPLRRGALRPHFSVAGTTTRLNCHRFCIFGTAAGEARASIPRCARHLPGDAREQRARDQRAVARLGCRAARAERRARTAHRELVTGASCCSAATRSPSNGPGDRRRTRQSGARATRSAARTCASGCCWQLERRAPRRARDRTGKIAVRRAAGAGRARSTRADDRERVERELREVFALYAHRASSSRRARASPGRKERCGGEDQAARDRGRGLDLTERLHRGPPAVAAGAARHGTGRGLDLDRRHARRAHREGHRARRSPRMCRWHEHYTAACAFALPLLVEMDDPDSDCLRVCDRLAERAVARAQAGDRLRGQRVHRVAARTGC